MSQPSFPRLAGILMVLVVILGTSPLLQISGMQSAKAFPGGISPNSPQVTLVTLWHAWTDSEKPGLEQVVADFEAAHPEIDIELAQHPFADLPFNFEDEAKMGGGPTLVITASDWGPTFYDEGLIADLTGLVDEELLDTILPNAMPAVQYKGALIGLPQTTKGVLLFRNKAIIPDPVASFAGLIEAAQEAAEGDVVGADLERGFFFTAGHLHALGGRVMDAEGCPAFFSADGLEWLDLLATFPEAGPTEQYTDTDIERFKAGQAGFIIDGTWNLRAIEDAVGSTNLAIDPWPTPLSGYVQVETINLNDNASAAEKSAALIFMEYMLSIEAQESLLAIGHLPAASGVTFTDPHLQQAMEIFETGVPFPVVPQLASYWGPMDAALALFYAGDAGAEATLKNATEDIVAALAAKGYTCKESYHVYLPAGLR
jgi:maltose-binding protein MalE